MTRPLTDIDIFQLWDNPQERQWEDVLENRYWAYVGDKNKAVEKEFQNLDINRIKTMNPEEWYKFLEEEYFKWKFTAANRYTSTTKHLKKYLDIPYGLEELHIMKKNIFEFDKDDILRGLEIARSIKGLGSAGASGLLAVLFPEKFGTVDQFVANALNKVKETNIKNVENLSNKDAILMIEIMKDKACELNNLFSTSKWTPRKVDMVLWVTRQN